MSGLNLRNSPEMRSDFRKTLLIRILSRLDISVNALALLLGSRRGQIVNRCFDYPGINSHINLNLTALKELKEHLRVAQLIRSSVRKHLLNREETLLMSLRSIKRIAAIRSRLSHIRGNQILFSLRALNRFSVSHKTYIKIKQ